MQRRKFSREFKLEAVKLVRERGVAVAQGCAGSGPARERAAQWVREQQADPDRHSRSRRNEARAVEIERLRREVGQDEGEGDILKAAAYFARDRYEVRVRREAPRDLAGVVDLRRAR